MRINIITTSRDEVMRNASSIRNPKSAIRNWYTVLLMLLASSSVAERPVNAEAIHYLIEGVYYLIDENAPKHAIPYFERAIELDPNHKDAYYFLGVSYYRIAQMLQIPPSSRSFPPLEGDGINQSLAHALFYLQEAEKRGVEHDRFRPNLLLEIQTRYPALQPVAPPIANSASQDSVTRGAQRYHEARVIVEGFGGNWGSISLQSPTGSTEYLLGEPIPLEGGKRYTIRFEHRRVNPLVKRLTLITSVIAVLMLR